MRITIETDHGTGVNTMHPSWEQLQNVILTALYGEAGDDQASDSHFVKISRDDNASNYRAHGAYTVMLRDGATVKIVSEK